MRVPSSYELRAMQDCTMKPRSKLICRSQPKITTHNCLPALSTHLRPFQAADRKAIFRLLSILPSLYPKGESWLNRRLDDVLKRKARCTVAVNGSHIVGTTIETPKGPHRCKLSTIFVDPNFRNQSIGTLLLDRCQNDWLRHDISGVYVTTDSRRADFLVPLLTRFNFKVTAVEINRYGLERDETIFSWVLPGL